MNVLVACEESQRVCCAFRELGHNAFSCDIQECSGGHPEWHILDDVTKYLNGTSDDFCRCPLVFYTQDGLPHIAPWKWDLIIAFPPCTYFSRINFLNYYRNGVFNEQRFKDAQPFINLFLDIYNADCERICIENPVPFSLFSDILPPYSMYLEPYEFGEKYRKRTCLWLKGLPYLMPTGKCVDFSSYVVLNGNLIDGKFNLKERSKYRSKTFFGVARAMAQQWGK